MPEIALPELALLESANLPALTQLHHHLFTRELRRLYLDNPRTKVQLAGGS